MDICTCWSSEREPWNPYETVLYDTLEIWSFQDFFYLCPPLYKNCHNYMFHQRNLIFICYRVFHSIFNCVLFEKNSLVYCALLLCFTTFFAVSILCFTTICSKQILRVFLLLKLQCWKFTQKFITKIHVLINASTPNRDTALAFNSCLVLVVKRISEFDNASDYEWSLESQNDHEQTITNLLIFSIYLWKTLRVSRGKSTFAHHSFNVAIFKQAITGYFILRHIFFQTSIRIQRSIYFLIFHWIGTQCWKVKKSSGSEQCETMYHGNFTSSDKIPIETASQILIEHNSLFNNLYIHEIIVLIIIKN